MKWSLICTLFIAAIGIALVAAAPGAGRAADAPEKFNLADLADGESRTFGEGDHAVTATRKGGEITITLRSDSPKGGKETFTCAVGKDHCYVMTRGEDGKGQVVVLSKSDAGKDGKKTVTTRVVASGDSAGEKNIMVFTPDDGDENVIIKELEPGMKWVTSQVDVDDDSGEVIIHSDGEGMAVVTTDISETEPGVKVIRIVAEGGTVLRCPEGDATLTLKKGEEKTGPYFCPRHNLKMEPAKEPVIIKEKVKVEKKSGSHAEEY
jgi:hypothetical protein